jgi:hypothetical protein
MLARRFRVLLGLAASCLGGAAAAGCGEDGRVGAEDEAGAGGSTAVAVGESGRTGQGGSAAGVASSGAGGGGQAGQGAGGAAACQSVAARVREEELPNVNASLAGLSFTGDVPAFVDQILARRYPFGLGLVRGGRMDTEFGDCSELFAGDPDSAADVYASMEVIVHECGHVYDAFLSGNNRDAYELTPELSFRCERGDTTSRGGDTFARSRIVGDGFASLRPACGGVSSPGCDPYADVYLDGDPDDTVFESGDQGYNLLLEESVQYVNSIATAWAFVDQQPQNIAVSARDGILTFLWYIERYLRMARTEFPGAYERITQDECWLELTLGVWARAERYLELTSAERGLGIADDELLDLVQDPELLDEIERLRELDCR